MKNHIEVVSYNNDWPAMFEEERKIISAALGKSIHRKVGFRKLKNFYVFNVEE
jgi:hypothetical protein